MWGYEDPKQERSRQDYFWGGEFREESLEKIYFSNKGVQDVDIAKNTEDSLLTSDGRELGVQGVQCNPKGDKGNLV